MLDAHPVKRFPGLVGATNPNSPPEGATEIDQDTVRRSLNTVESRRGYKASASCSAPINAIGFKQGYVIALTYDTPSNTGTLRSYNPATDTWATLPMTPGNLTLDRPGISGAHTRFVSAQKALYFQSKYGLTKIEDISTGVCRAAVQPKNWVQPYNGVAGGPLYSILGGSFGYSQLPSPAPSLWFTALNKTAYRFTICRLGANKELIESEPSERLVTTNFGVLGVVIMVPEISPMFPPDAFFRIYRVNPQVPQANEPGDEMFLVAEFVPPTGVGTDANGFLNIINTAEHSFIDPGGSLTDSTPDTSLYIPLYTNPSSGGGIASANTSPPLAADMAQFKSRMYHLNTSDVQRMTIRVIGTGTGGIVAGAQITIRGAVFTFVIAAGVEQPPTVGLFTSLGSVAQNIDATARALVIAINTYFWGNPFSSGTQPIDSGPYTSKIYATYLGTSAASAGQILLQTVVPGAPAFTVTTSSAAGWGSDYTKGATSDPNAQVSGLGWSPSNQPESMPLANNNAIGDPTAAGQRIIALKETLFAFKQDGLWKITDDGSTLGPTVQLVDPTIRLVAPESAVAVDNMIFALCDQGVVRISETGAVDNISHLQIERDLFKLMAYVGASTLAEKAFGVAYLPEHTYILCLPESPNATNCTKQYVYNLQSQAWTSWNIPGGVTSGAVHPDTGQLYFGRSDGTLCIERKDFASTDYQDPGFSIASPTATATATLVFSGDLRTGSTPFAVGDIVQQFQASKALQQRVIAVSYSSSANQTTVTLNAAPATAWNQSVNLTVVKAIPAYTKFLPFTADQPITDKEWGDAFLSFRYNDLDAISVGWASEKVPITNTAVEPISAAQSTSRGDPGPIALDGWGSKAWGAALWGRQAKDVVLKCSVPQDFAHSSQLTLSLSMPCALQRFELSAIDIKIAGMTDKVVR